MMWFLVEYPDGAKAINQFIDLQAFTKWVRENKSVTITAPIELQEPFEIKVNECLQAEA